MAERSETVTLTVDGMRHDGWTDIEITRAIDAMVGTFRLELTERGADRSTAFPLEAGAACTVSIGDEVVITGWIDQLGPVLEAQTHTITISGRDRAADLVDCSAIAIPGSWRDTRIEQIAAELARPFNLTVIARADTGPALRRFALQQGETVQAALERLCRFAGLLAISTPEGNVELIEPERSGAIERIEEGVNLLGGSAAHDVSQRYSDYLVKGQASGDDTASGKTVSQPKASAKDPAVRRYRPLLLIAEDQATSANLERRVAWEASVRAGRAQPITIRAAGWRRPDGQLRAPNTIVAVTAPSLFAAGELLVQSVRLTQGAAGTLSELECVPPAAWSQLAVPETAQASRIAS